MIIRPLKAPLSYTLGKGQDDPRQPEVIDGNVDDFRKVEAASKSARKSAHFALSYELEDKPPLERLVEDVREVLCFLGRVESHTELAYVAVLHHEAAGDQVGDRMEARLKSYRYAVHLHVAQVDLTTGKRIQFFYRKRDGQRIWQWLVEFNTIRHYACPSELPRARSHRPRWTQCQLNNAAAELRDLSLARLRGGGPLAEQEWANLLKPFDQEGRIECYRRRDALIAKIYFRGMRSAHALRLTNQGVLKVRAAKAVTRARPKDNEGGAQSCRRLEEACLVKVPESVADQSQCYADCEIDTLEPINLRTANLPRPPSMQPTA